jgi:hypothetical protein
LQDCEDALRATSPEMIEASAVHPELLPDYRPHRDRQRI